MQVYIVAAINLFLFSGFLVFMVWASAKLLLGAGKLLVTLVRRVRKS